MNKDELRGKQIAKKVMREMLGSTDHRADIKQVAERYVGSYREALYANKHINVYCRLLKTALKDLP